MITPNQFKRGAKIELDGEPYGIVEYLHIKCGRGGGATVRTKVKSFVPELLSSVLSNQMKRSSNLTLKIKLCSTFIMMVRLSSLWITRATSR